jgi:hypothetical protein
VQTPSTELSEEKYEKSGDEEKGEEREEREPGRMENHVPAGARARLLPKALHADTRKTRSGVLWG